MNFSRTILIAVFLLASMTTGAAQDPSPEEVNRRGQAILDELQKRRDLRTFYGYKVANVYFPTKEFRMPPDDMPGFPVGLAAQFYANLTNREVMVSSRVASTMLSIDRSNSNEKDLVRALNVAGVRITEIGRSTVAFTDKSD